MMSVEQQAQALADWLAENPGAEPPEGVDSDVIEAVYALRPDLAPAPRVSLDEILGLVSEGPLAAPTVPMVERSVPSAATPVVSSVPDAVSTPTPANNNRRLWAVLGGVAALAAAVLVTVQVTMTAGQGTFAPESSAPSMTRAPMEAAPSGDAEGAARQQQLAVGATVATEQPSTQDTGGSPLDAVADLDEGDRFNEDELFERANEAERPDAFQEEVELGGAESGLVARGLNDETRTSDDAIQTIGTASNMRAGDVSWRDADDGDASGGDAGLVGGGAGGVGRNQLASAPEPASVRPAPAPPDAAELARSTTEVAADIPPPPAAAATPALMEEAQGGEFLEVAVADLEEYPEEEADEALDDVISATGELGSDTRSVDQLIVVESTSISGGRERRERGPRPSRQPQAEQAPVEDPVAAPVASSADSLFGGAGVDAGVAQAQQRAQALAAAQQYGAAFDILSGYVSPSAPIDLILDATEYAFAAGRWADTIRVAAVRLDANVPSDSPQARSRLYDYRSRAQAMLDQRMMAPSSTSDSP